jgi:hypothetical protein
MKFPPPLMSEQPRGARIFFMIVLPIAAGALCGVLLGASEPAYLIVSLITVAGGYLAGFDHLGAGAGARRGFLGGLLFGSSILIGHEIAGTDPKADIPDPGILLIVITVVLGIALGALGGRARAKREGTAEA